MRQATTRLAADAAFLGESGCGGSAWASAYRGRSVAAHSLSQSGEGARTMISARPEAADSLYAAMRYVARERCMGPSH
jgi:hypothetical protein